jgi:Icc-related predicted phosphoesterase
MIIDCISDLHGYYPELDGGDLLIIAGDLTARDTPQQIDEFGSWLYGQNYRKKIFIAGNHDNILQKSDTPRKFNIRIGDKVYEKYEYLCDSCTEFEGLKIYGSPWTTTFEGINPKCKAFTVDTEEELAKKWACIPDDIDILITHSPPYGIFDQTESGESVGSIELRNIVLSSDRMTKLKLHVFGHIHGEGIGVLQTTRTKFINASHVNERYQPVNESIRIIL